MNLRPEIVFRLWESLCAPSSSKSKWPIDKEKRECGTNREVCERCAPSRVKASTFSQRRQNDAEGERRAWKRIIICQGRVLDQCRASDWHRGRRVVSGGFDRHSPAFAPFPKWHTSSDFESIDRTSRVHERSYKKTSLQFRSWREGWVGVFRVP